MASVTVRTVLADTRIPASVASVVAAWANGSSAPRWPVARRTPGLWLARPSPSAGSSGQDPWPHAGHQ